MKRTKTILLADDDPDFLEQHRLTLEAHGYAVVAATSAQAALDASADKDLDGAILDIIMESPDSGFELARKLRKIERFKKLPIFLLSSINSVNEAKGLAFRYGDNDLDDVWMPVQKILEKPVKPKVLIELVREHMGAP